MTTSSDSLSGVSLCEGNPRWIDSLRALLALHQRLPRFTYKDLPLDWSLAGWAPLVVARAALPRAEAKEAAGTISAVGPAFRDHLAIAPVVSVSTTRFSTVPAFGPRPS